ncbi:MAG: phosphatidylserine decarboxylase family protein [Thermodesulfobacteriota bacterium]
MKQQYHRVDTPQASAFPVASAGYPFILAAAFATLVFALLEIAALAIIALVATFFIACFFRDPERFTPETADAVVSPADGRVIKTEALTDCPYMEGGCIKIGIFMSIFNVHVNRVPFSGTIDQTLYQPGRFVSANRESASMKNEHQAIILTTENGRQLCFVQVAGMIARRIICRLSPGDRVSRGERFGMICFGSRLDVYLPPDAEPAVSAGDRVKAGQSILAHLS